MNLKRFIKRMKLLKPELLYVCGYYHCYKLVTFKLKIKSFKLK